MGLADMVILSDAEALAVRGKGWHPDLDLDVDLGEGEKPWVAVGGISLAALSHEDGQAGSINFYLAEGKYSAGGSNLSEAGKTVTETLSVDIGGVIKSETTIKSIHVFAGGASSSWAL